MVDEYKFVDIHCHLLPGIDDGARDWDESIAMARIAVRDGIKLSIVTPHQLGQYSQTLGTEIRQLTAEFQQRLNDLDIPLRVLPGADVRIDSDMLERLRSGDCVTLGDQKKHVLLELPHELYVPLEPVLSSLEKLGITGILSHPERNEGILKKPELIRPLVDAGCLMQITADSLNGTFGDAPEKLCQWMLKQELVHFLSSDAHDTRRRRPTIRRSFQRAEQIVGQDYARAICCTNPLAVAMGKRVPQLPAIKRRGLMDRFFSRRAA